LSDDNKVQDLRQLKTQLEMERASFISHWKELANNILPRRAQFQLSNSNKGDKRNQSIKDETATIAARSLRAGMMGGITSPSRPWFRLSVVDPDLMDNAEVKVWLHEVTRRMISVFIRSNLYHALPVVYGDVSVFGTAALGVEEDYSGDVVRFYSFPIGSYCIAQNDKLQVDVFVRDIRLTVRQLVAKFGEVKNGKIVSKNISENVKQRWEEPAGKDQPVEITHVIQPNYKWDPEDPTSFRYISSYFENSNVEDLLLREGGFNYFPALCPRWELTGEDIYGTNCPGMEALPAIKQLHNMELRSIQAVEKMINPPMMGPLSLKQAKASALPGDITYVDVRNGMEGFKPVYQINYDLQAHEVKQEKVRQRIRKIFFEDMLLMFANMEARERVTAFEIQARKEEKLLVLGPVLERLNQDLLDPLITITFDIMARQGLIPTPPMELQGQPLKVEYLSIMHQAQKSTGLAGLDRLKQHAAEMAQISPMTMDKFNLDEISDEYAEILGVPPKVLRSNEDVAKIREARAQAQAAQQQELSDRENLKAATPIAKMVQQ